MGCKVLDIPSAAECKNKCLADCEKQLIPDYVGECMLKAQSCKELGECPLDGSGKAETEAEPAPAGESSAFTVKPEENNIAPSPHAFDNPPAAGELAPPPVD